MKLVRIELRHGLLAVAALFLAETAFARILEPVSGPPGKTGEYPPEIFAIIEAVGGTDVSAPANPSPSKSKAKSAASSNKASFGADLKASHSSFSQKLLGEHKKAATGWKNRHKNTIMEWKREQASYFQKIPIYKESLARIELSSPVSAAKAQAPVASQEIKGVHIVGRAFYPEIKDQGRRSTCAAFAAVRSLEIILAQNMINADLSEQYFYWASKTKCQKKRCSKRGSWVTPGFQRSLNGDVTDIPKEDDCPYNSSVRAGNATQIPLANSCHMKGKTLVKGFAKLDTLDDAVEALNSDMPVIAGLTLSPNFYRNNGLVGLTTKATAKVNAHSRGHAILFVGYVKLPAQLRAEEGKLCFITANSWGKGWGVGGYSCLTENWIRKHRLNMSFVAPSSLGM